MDSMKIKPVKCIICGKLMTSFIELNNPDPLASRNDGFVCCSDCDWAYVIPARMGRQTAKLFPDIMNDIQLRVESRNPEYIEEPREID